MALRTMDHPLLTARRSSLKPCLRARRTHPTPSTIASHAIPPHDAPRRALSLLAALPASAQGLDLTINHVGLGIGDVPRVIGLRLNYRDRHLERVDGVNATIWSPYDNGGNGVVRGVALGVPVTGAARIDGVAIGIFGVGARERIRGIGIGALGVGANELDRDHGRRAGRRDWRRTSPGIGVGGLGRRQRRLAARHLRRRTRCRQRSGHHRPRRRRARRGSEPQHEGDRHRRTRRRRERGRDGAARRRTRRRGGRFREGDPRRWAGRRGVEGGPRHRHRRAGSRRG